MQPELRIFVDKACPICDEARRLASLAQQKLPNFRVALIDVSCDGAIIPEQVFAVPTYMLDGTTLWLGNPGEKEFLERLKHATPKSKDH